MNYKKQKAWLTALVAMPLLLQAQVTLPKLVSDSMVLQRNQNVRIWGWAAAGEKVSVEFNGKTYTATTGSDGKWATLLAPTREGGPYNMTIKASNTITLRNILIGDVWLCSGQSNMEFPMSRIMHLHADDVKKAAGYPIREFEVERRYSFVPVKDVEGRWKPATPQNLPRFSAVAYFMAQSLYLQYKIPIGIIHSSWPGTPAESWISEEGLKPFPHYIKIAQQFRDTAYVTGLLKNDQKVTSEWNARVKANGKPLQETGDWKTVRFPGYWEQQGAPDLNGLVWVKKTITVPADFNTGNVFLELGLVDDIDSTFLNGKPLGYSNNKYLPRRYAVPAGTLKTGENTIVVKIIDNEGPGGMAPGKQYRLTNGSQSIDLSGDWQYQVGYASAPLPVQTFTRVFYKPECLYYGMIEPLTPYTIKGAAWYQGEANSGKDKAFEYRTLLPAMIREWRAKWGQGNFPFVLVQLANYMQPKTEPGESNWAMLRESQSVVAATEPDCGLAVAIDLGEANDIHPFRKKEVGERLALQAARLAYGSKAVASGPVYQSLEIKGNTIVLSFTSIGKGLVAKGGKLQQFAIAGSDGKFVWADAVIKGDKMVVQSPLVSGPVAVRYAWADNPEGCNLYNKEGLPASPFRTDNWVK